MEIFIVTAEYVYDGIVSQWIFTDRDAAIDKGVVVGVAIDRGACVGDVVTVKGPFAVGEATNVDDRIIYSRNLRFEKAEAMKRVREKREIA